MQTPFFKKLPVAVASLALLSCVHAHAQTAPVAPPVQISGIVPPPLPLNSAGKVVVNLALPPIPAPAPDKAASALKDASASKEVSLVAPPLAANSLALIAKTATSSSDAQSALVLPSMPIAPPSDKNEKEVNSTTGEGSNKKSADASICAPAPVVLKKPDQTKVPNQKVKESNPKNKESAEKQVKPDAPVSPFIGLAQTQVSDTQLNQFVFPEAVEGLYFPEGAPLPECPKDATPNDPCKPVFLNGRQLLLLPLRIGAKGPVQMLAHMHSGRMITFNLAPVSGPGTVIRVEGAGYSASDARVKKSQADESTITSSSLQADIALLDLFVNGLPAAGFESVAANPITKMDLFDVIPMAAWMDGNKLKVHLWKIQPKDNTPIRLSASLFQTDGVRAVALDKESATKASPSFVYLLEELK